VRVETSRVVAMWKWVEETDQRFSRRRTPVRLLCAYFVRVMWCIADVFLDKANISSDDDGGDLIHVHALNDISTVTCGCDARRARLRVFWIRFPLHM
jgi:hypothetical protein